MTAAEDPADAVIELGVKCQRNGCQASFSGEGSRGEVCWHHPGVVVFHDASKGWSCCKPRVADFSDLFQIEACTEGRHNFVKVAKKEEAVTCRFVSLSLLFPCSFVCLFVRRLLVACGGEDFIASSLCLPLPLSPSSLPAAL